MRTANVRDFGAVGDGVTDDTEAFNRATKASATWSPALEYAIFVPAGRYRISGTVYVRKGQSLYGEGLSSHIDASDAKRSTFVLGKHISGGRPADDPGGAPVKISNLRGLGGADSNGFIYTNAQGFQISGLFLSATGIGIEIEGADGIMSDVAIDMCLSGMVFRRCQNIVVNNVNIFSPNYAISLMGGCRDIAFSNIIVSYTKYVSVLFADAERDIDNILFSNCIFSNNVQHDTFAGYVHNRASAVSAAFRSCSFRNWPRHAVSHGTGVDVALSFDTCTFDGAPTNPLYNRSVSARGIITGVGRYRFTNCEFRNLIGEIAMVNDDASELAIIEGNVRDCAPVRLAFAPRSGGKVSIRDVDGFASVTSDATRASITLPWWGKRTTWKLGIAADDMPAREFLVVVTAAATAALPTIETLTSRSTDPSSGRAVPAVSVSRTGSASGVVTIKVQTENASANNLTVEAATVG